MTVALLKYVVCGIRRGRSKLCADLWKEEALARNNRCATNKERVFIDGRETVSART